MMKRLIFLLVIIIGSTSMLKAIDGYNQHLSPEEFRKKQMAFITEKADLTEEEASKFFPLYFELQDKKKELNDKSWKLLHQGKNAELTEEQYEEIIMGIHDLRIESIQLEKAYYQKFRKIISAKKIYMVQRAETRFHREIVRGVNKGEPRKDKK